MADETNHAMALFEQVNQRLAEQEAYEADILDLDMVPGSYLAAEQTSAKSPRFTYSPIKDGPMLYGADASLVKWDAESKKLQPASITAALALAERGDSLDLYQAVTGAHFANQLKWNADSGTLSLNPSAILQISKGSPEHARSLEVSRPISLDEHINALVLKTVAASKVEPAVAESSASDEEAEEIDQAEDTDATEEEAVIANPAGHGLAQPQGQLHAGPGTPAAFAADSLAKICDACIGATDKTVRMAGGLAIDGARNTVRGCSELFDKWKSDRQALNAVATANASEQVADNFENSPISTFDLDDEGEVESVVSDIDPDFLQKNAERMNEQTHAVKAEFEERREGFRKTINNKLETVFQAMGYGDPMKSKAQSLEEFQAELETLPDIKKAKVEKAIADIQKEGTEFRNYLKAKSESPEFEESDLGDQNDIADYANKLEESIPEEFDKKYRDMLDKIGIGDTAIREQLSRLFSKLGQLFDRVFQRFSSQQDYVDMASQVHSEQHQAVRPG